MVLFANLLQNATTDSHTITVTWSGTGLTLSLGAAITRALNFAAPSPMGMGTVTNPTGSPISLTPSFTFSGALTQAQTVNYSVVLIQIA